MFHVKHSLESSLKELNLPFNEEKLNKLEFYIDELLRWNEKINLVSRQLTKEDIAKKLILPSLIPHKIIPVGEDILDFGSGAGIVGIPLVIFKGETSFTLLESKIKPITFLRHISNTLSINVEIIHKFVKKQGDLPKHYDTILARGIDPEVIPAGIGRKIIYYGEYRGNKLKIKSSIDWKNYKVSILTL